MLLVKMLPIEKLKMYEMYSRIMFLLETFFYFSLICNVGLLFNYSFKLAVYAMMLVVLLNVY